MPSKASARFFISLLPVLLAAAAAADSAPFNITTVLQGFPDFSAYNELLTKTKIADEINRRRSITVFVVDGSAIGAITSLAPEVQKRVVAVHVLLDYYDSAKINELAGTFASVTTLYQTSGNADQRQGYVNLTEYGHNIKIGSSMPGAPLDVELTQIVYTKPYDLSVLQISKAIIPPGIEKSTGDVKASTAPSNSSQQPSTPSVSPTPPPQPAQASAPTGQVSAPTPAPANKSTPAPANTSTPTPSPTAATAPKAETPKADAPTAANNTAPAATPKADAPKASTPTAADAPEAETPAAETPAADVPAADSPAADAPASDADSPAADAPVADAPAADGPMADGPSTDTTDAEADGESGARRVAVGAGVGAVAMAAFMLGL